MAKCEYCLHSAVCRAHCEEEHQEGCSTCMIRVCNYCDEAEKCRFFKSSAEISEELHEA